MVEKLQKGIENVLGFDGKTIAIAGNSLQPESFDLKDWHGEACFVELHANRSKITVHDLAAKLGALENEIRSNGVLIPCGKYHFKVSDCSCPLLNGLMQEENVVVLETLHSMSLAHQATNSLELSEKFAYQSLNWCKTMLEGEAAWQSVILMNLARLQLREERYADCEKLLQSCLELDSKFDMSEPGTVGEMYYYIGLIKYRQGLFHDSLHWLAKSKRIVEYNLGQDDSHVGTLHNLLGMNYEALGQLESSKFELLQALRVFQARRDVRSSVEVLNNLAIVHLKDGDTVNGERMVEELVKWNEFGEEQCKRDPAHVHFSQTLAHNREFASSAHSSEQLAARAGVHDFILQCVAAEDSQLNGLMNDGRRELDSSKYLEALRTFSKAFKHSLTRFGDKHPNTARALMGIAVSYHHLDNLEQALAKLKFALNIMKMFQGAQHDEVMQMRCNLGAIYLDMSTRKAAADSHTLLDLALQEFEPVLQHNVSKFGLNSPCAAHMLRCIGEVKLAKREVEASKELLWQALSIMDKTLGPSHPDTLSLHQLLLTVLQERALATEERFRRTSEIQQDSWEELKMRKQQRMEEWQACLQWNKRSIVDAQDVRHTIQHTTRCKKKAEVGSAQQDKAGVVMPEDAGMMRVRFDDGEELVCSREQLSELVEFTLPEGLEPGREVVIRNLNHAAVFNGAHARIAEANDKDWEWVRVTLADGSKVEVRYLNLDYQLPPGLRPGMRVRARGIHGVRDGQVGTIIRAFESDPGRALLRWESDRKLGAVGLAKLEVVMRRGWERGGRVILGAKNKLADVSMSNQTGTVEDVDPLDPDRVVVLLHNSDRRVSVRYEHLSFVLPKYSMHRVVEDLYGRKGIIVREDDSFMQHVMVLLFEVYQGCGGEAISYNLNKLTFLDLPDLPGFHTRAWVKLKGLQSFSYNGMQGYLQSPSPHDPERVVIELDGGKLIEVHLDHVDVQ